VDNQLFDIAMTLITLLSLTFAWLGKKKRLPKWLDNWLSHVGLARIYDALEEANKFLQMSPTQRRNEAVKILKAECKSQLNFELPTSIANLLIEYGYQLWRAGVKVTRKK